MFAVQAMTVVAGITISRLVAQTLTTITRVIVVHLGGNFGHQEAKDSGKEARQFGVGEAARAMVVLPMLINQAVAGTILVVQ